MINELLFIYFLPPTGKLYENSFSSGRANNLDAEELVRSSVDRATAS